MPNKVTVTFEGKDAIDAMLSAYEQSHAFLEAASLSKPQARLTVELQPSGNGVSEDIVIRDDKPLDNDAVLHCALDLLMTVYTSDKTVNNKSSTDAVNALLEKYSVDSLNDVPTEQASKLFKDAERIASEYGVSN